MPPPPPPPRRSGSGSKPPPLPEWRKYSTPTPAPNPAARQYSPQQEYVEDVSTYELATPGDDSYDLAPEAPVTAAVPTTKTCPACYSPTANLSVLCMRCGYNFQTGYRPLPRDKQVASQSSMFADANGAITIFCFWDFILAGVSIACSLFALAFGAQITHPLIVIAIAIAVIISLGGVVRNVRIVGQESILLAIGLFIIPFLHLILVIMRWHELGRGFISMLVGNICTFIAVAAAGALLAA